MPLFVYKPEGAEPRKWVVDFPKMLIAEVQAVQKASGLKYAAWPDALGEADADLIHALLWVFLKRNNPTLTQSQVEFTMSEIDLELTDDEVRQTRAALREKAAVEALNDDERTLLATVEAADVPDLLSDEDDDEDAVPKGK